ncbi:hypothetical protein K461DRAFT_283112 [Myriangium duriaei CBS 260.36]|uniref:2EXR domain-containing protein n=1 Tax=Myriangium duriaei CBS 260.36 TaxID=1168546 RepID=A0A9P4MHM1_9PEZI|nr:hypothetical protein K461DRAFT_283112 [Myriangium duriaei CBS 260.36]
MSVQSWSHKAVSIRHRISSIKRSLATRRSSPTLAHESPTFHFFPLLPAELRAEIWHLSLPSSPYDGPPSLMIYDPDLWFQSVSVRESSDAESEPLEVYDMEYALDLLPPIHVSVPPAFVNREAHAIARPWLEAHRDEIWYSKASGLYRLFDPERDALYVPLEKFELFRKSYNWESVWWKRAGKKLGGLWPVGWWQAYRDRRRMDWIVSVTWCGLRTIAFDQEIVEKYSSWAIMAALEEGWNVWSAAEQALDTLLVVVRKERQGKDESWTWKDASVEKLVRDGVGMPWTRYNDGETDIIEEWMLPDSADEGAALNFLRDARMINSLNEIRTVVAVQE